MGLDTAAVTAVAGTTDAYFGIQQFTVNHKTCQIEWSLYTYLDYAINPKSIAFCITPYTIQ